MTRFLLIPLLGPGAPVLQHERLRVTNIADSVQILDPESEIAVIKELEKKVGDLEDALGEAEDEVEDLQRQIDNNA